MAGGVLHPTRWNSIVVFVAQDGPLRQQYLKLKANHGLTQLYMTKTKKRALVGPNLYTNTAVDSRARASACRVNIKHPKRAYARAARAHGLTQLYKTKTKKRTLVGPNLQIRPWTHVRVPARAA